MTFLGGSITTFGDSGRLALDCWATEFAQPADLSRVCLDPTLSKSSACDSDPHQLPFVNSTSMRVCSLSAPAFFFSFSSSRSCYRKHSSSSCCCNLGRNSCSCCSFRRRSSISFRSCSNSNCCSRSHCSVFFLALKISSSISSIRRLLEDREWAILVSFLLPCVVECLEETWTFSSAFFIAPFLLSLKFRLGFYHQSM